MPIPMPVSVPVRGFSPAARAAATVPGVTP